MCHGVIDTPQAHNIVAIYTYSLNILDIQLVYHIHLIMMRFKD